MKNIMVAVFVAIIGVLSAVSAYAEDLFTTPTIDVTILGPLMTAILAALALIWAFRKGVKISNRS